MENKNSLLPLAAIKKYKKFFIISVFILLVSFMINAFGVVPIDDFVVFQNDSDALVANSVRCEGELFNGQLLILDNSKSGVNGNSCIKDNYISYQSQFGLQGRVFTLMYRVLKIVNISYGVSIVLFYFINALMSATVMGLLVLWVRNKFGFTPSTVLMFGIAMSPIVVEFAKSLYWCAPLLFLPIIFTLYYFPRYNKRFVFWFVLWLILYLRFLCGYEYITTISIMVFSIISYFLFINKTRFSQYLRVGLITLAVSIMAFGAALSTHAISLRSDHLSMVDAINIVVSRAKDRSVDVGDKYADFPNGWLQTRNPAYYKVVNFLANNDNMTLQHPKLWSMFSFISVYLLSPVINLPVSFNDSFGGYFQSTAVFFLILIVLYFAYFKKQKGTNIREIQALYLVVIFGLLGYLSWLIFAHQHSMIHVFLNVILMYMPAVLFGYIIIGVFIESIFKKRIKFRKK